MVVYAICVKGTGKYLPAKRDGRGRGRGFSWDEPEQGGGKYGPRLHGTLVGARNTLVSWLHGPYKNVSVQYSFDSDPEWETRAVEPSALSPRRSEDMEIVQFILTPLKERIQLVRQQNAS